MGNTFTKVLVTDFFVSSVLLHNRVCVYEIPEFGLLCKSVFSKPCYNSACNVHRCKMQGGRQRIGKGGSNFSIYEVSRSVLRAQLCNIMLDEIWSENPLINDARRLMEKGKEARPDSVDRCMENLDSAISIMEELDKKRGQDYYLLAEVYCLRALCKHQSNLESQSLFEDLNFALVHWRSEDCYNFTQQTRLVSPHSVNLLHYALDLILLKDIKNELFDKLDIYNMIIKFSRHTSLSADADQKCLTKILQSRSHYHALCTSPMDESIITIHHHHGTEVLSNITGKIHRKKQSWDFQKMLEDVKDECSFISCSNCRVILEARAEQELGNLVRTHSNSFNIDDNNRKQLLNEAENYFLEAKSKLTCSIWFAYNDVSNPKKEDVGGI